jgi:predicted metal-dependent phosphoesterase TrpH
MYIELHAASAFSFLQGASLPEALVDRAAALGYPALALLDADGVYGAPRFHKAAQKAGLRAIIGAELTIGHAGRGVGRGFSPAAMRVFADLWDIERLYDCTCSRERAARLARMNREQAAPPPVACACNGR